MRAVLYAVLATGTAVLTLAAVLTIALCRAAGENGDHP